MRAGTGNSAEAVNTPGMSSIGPITSNYWPPPETATPVPTVQDTTTPAPEAQATPVPSPQAQPTPAQTPAASVTVLSGSVPQPVNTTA
jgi:hypothetical protein